VHKSTCRGGSDGILLVILVVVVCRGFLLGGPLEKEEGSGQKVIVGRWLAQFSYKTCGGSVG
jgi:hypothetical protein